MTLKLSDQIRRWALEAKENGQTSVYELSQATGIPTQSLYRWMAGTRGLCKENIDAIAEFFDLEIQ